MYRGQILPGKSIEKKLQGEKIARVKIGVEKWVTKILPEKNALHPIIIIIGI